MAGVSVVIPAHNEAAVIGRLLDALLAGAAPDEFEIVVVANGCTDDTFKIAAGYAPAVTAVETPVPSKHHALRLGDQHATAYPRIYVDADVVLTATDVRSLADALREPGVHAAVPNRRMELTGRPLLVRWYFDVWQRLPGVDEALYGRGVIAVSETGQRRLAEQPELMGDDLIATLVIPSPQRRVVRSATVVVHAPRTMGDLLRRRIRSLTTTAQLRQHLPEATDNARTNKNQIFAVVRAQPTSIGKVCAFLAVTLVARWRARKPIRTGDYQTWLRDESSRTVIP